LLVLLVVTRHRDPSHLLAAADTRPSMADGM